MSHDAREAVPSHLAGAVSEEAIRHLMIRSDLNRAIYKVVREHMMSNMCDEDDRWIPYPLVDLMSNPAPSDIGTGEMEMITLVDEVEAAVATLSPMGLLEEVREALEGIIAKMGEGPDAPGHCHDVAGIWDADNAPGIAGTSCEWCAHWKRARETLNKLPKLTGEGM